MEFNIINDKTIWSNFFNENGSLSFLQSWEWGEFQQKMGEEILRLGVFENNQLVALALIIKVRAKRGNFLFIPHGPIFKYQVSSIKYQDLLIALKQYLTTITKKEKFDFIRIAPILEDTSENQILFKNLGFKTAPIYLHAERMWVLALDKSEDELLYDMRKTTRYSIKKAARDGVIIEKRTDKQTISDFWKLYRQTAKREKFHPFSESFISQEFEAFHKSGQAIFLFAKVKEDYLASALIIFTKSTGFYHQGASIHTKIPATYLLQWEAIKETKKRGCSFYNFWGILQKGRTPKNWGGLTLFKTGFGGQQIDYLPTQDLKISSKYYLTFLYEKFLAWKRGV